MDVPLDRHAADGTADAIVIQRVLDGDTQAFGELVRRYQTTLYRHAVGLVLDHDVAADMVQDAFVRAYTQLASCRDRTRFRAWLMRTLRHRCLDYLKEPRRRHVRLDDAEPIVDPAEDAAGRVERARLRDELRAALAGLPPAQREPFLMHHVEGASYEAMAELLGASVSALKMRVLRARAALAEALGGQDVTDREPARLVVRRGSPGVRSPGLQEER